MNQLQWAKHVGRKRIEGVTIIHISDAISTYGAMMAAEGVICEDNKFRTAYPTPRGEMTGQADTFFSIPAYVYVGKVRVYGYVTNGDDGYKFVAYTYRKHHALVDGRW